MLSFDGASSWFKVQAWESGNRVLSEESDSPTAVAGNPPRLMQIGMRIQGGAPNRSPGCASGSLATAWMIAMDPQAFEIV